MSKSKIDFITDLLASKRLDSSMKQKLFELTAKELQNIEYSDKKILSEIEAIKRKIGLSEQEVTNSQMVLTNVPNNHDLPDYKNPRQISGFLMAYNQNVVLKTTTHDIDANALNSINAFLKIEKYVFNKHLEAIKSEFIRLSKEYSITPNLYTKIKGYINGDSLWSEDNISISWSNPSLINWALNNTNHCPNPGKDLHQESFTFSKINLKSGEFIRSFNELVAFFKNQVTIKHDNNLYDLCRIWNFKYNEKIEFNLDLLEKAKTIEFYTDVEKLYQAYCKILDLCLLFPPKEGGKPKIKISLEEIEVNELETQIHFKIHHTNSKFKKTIPWTKSRYGEQFTGIINNQINGLCDLELIADFDNEKYASLIIWPKTADYKILDSFEGVLYNLIFYR